LDIALVKLMVKTLCYIHTCDTKVAPYLAAIGSDQNQTTYG